MTRGKKIAAAMATMALTVTMSIGGTLAYLNYVTDSVTNTFSSAKSISTTLEEEFNPDEAAHYYPGQLISKVPTMTNTSADAAIWVAVSVSYASDGSNMSAEQFQTYATIAEKNTQDWIKIASALDGSELYLYSTVLATSVTTTPIFTGVTVNEDLEADLPTFSIDLKGFAIQSDGVTQQTAESELVKLANTSLNQTFSLVP